MCKRVFNFPIHHAGFNTLLYWGLSQQWMFEGVFMCIAVSIFWIIALTWNGYFLSICICLNKAALSWTRHDYDFLILFKSKSWCFLWLAALTAIRSDNKSSADQRCGWPHNLRWSSSSRCFPVMCCSPAVYTSGWIKCCDVHCVFTVYLHADRELQFYLHYHT